MSQLRERYDDHKIGTGMIKGAVIAPRKVLQLSESGTVLRKL